MVEGLVGAQSRSSGDVKACLKALRGSESDNRLEVLTRLHASLTSAAGVRGIERLLTSNSSRFDELFDVLSLPKLKKAEVEQVFKCLESVVLVLCVDVRHRQLVDALLRRLIVEHCGHIERLLVSNHNTSSRIKSGLRMLLLLTTASTSRRRLCFLAVSWLHPLTHVWKPLLTRRNSRDASGDVREMLLMLISRLLESGGADVVRVLLARRGILKEALLSSGCDGQAFVRLLRAVDADVLRNADVSKSMKIGFFSAGLVGSLCGMLEVGDGAVERILRTLLCSEKFGLVFRDDVDSSPLLARVLGAVPKPWKQQGGGRLTDLLVGIFNHYPFLVDAYLAADKLPPVETPTQFDLFTDFLGKLLAAPSSAAAAKSPALAALVAKSAADTGLSVAARLRFVAAAVSSNLLDDALVLRTAMDRLHGEMSSGEEDWFADYLVLLAKSKASSQLPPSFTGEEVAWAVGVVEKSSSSHLHEFICAICEDVRDFDLNALVVRPHCRRLLRLCDNPQQQMVKPVTYLVQVLHDLPFSHFEVLLMVQWAAAAGDGRTEALLAAFAAQEEEGGGGDSEFLRGVREKVFDDDGQQGFLDAWKKAVAEVPADDDAQITMAIESLQIAADRGVLVAIAADLVDRRRFQLAVAVMGDDDDLKALPKPQRRALRAFFAAAAEKPPDAVVEPPPSPLGPRWDPGEGLERGYRLLLDIEPDLVMKAVMEFDDARGGGGGDPTNLLLDSRLLPHLLFHLLNNTTEPPPIDCSVFLTKNLLAYLVRCLGSSCRTVRALSIAATAKLHLLLKHQRFQSIKTLRACVAHVLLRSAAAGRTEVPTRLAPVQALSLAVAVHECLLKNSIEMYHDLFNNKPTNSMLRMPMPRPFKRSLASTNAQHLQRITINILAKTVFNSRISHEIVRNDPEIYGFIVAHLTADCCASKALNANGKRIIEQAFKKAGGAGGANWLEKEYGTLVHEG